MDLRNHLNLINRHGYDGYIAVYNGPRLASNSPGDVVLVQDNRDGYCTIEKPLSQEDIGKNESVGNGIKTVCTCVNVPLRVIERIYT